VILAASLGMNEKAYEMYLRTARLDLDDYNNDTEDGLHITSMAGTWMSVVKGFGGMRVKDNTVHFNPFLPKQWKGFAFKVNFRTNVLEVKVTKKGAEISNLSGDDISIVVAGKTLHLKKGETK
jgi:maltose phosphorylase